MISNEAVQRLIATDRETLTQLMAAAMADGAMRGGIWNVYQDPDVRALIETARTLNAAPQPWQLMDGTWKTR